VALISNATGDLWQITSDGIANYANASSIFSQNTVIPNDNRNYMVPTSHQYVSFGEATIDGTITLNGDFTVFE
jgi:ligand-binding sensor domain-containing protein